MTPCILPWINFSTNTFGRPRVCGYSDIKVDTKLKDSDIATEWNSEYFKQIRRDFMRGEWPENCRRCKYVEELKGRSKRIEENHFYFNDNKHLIDQTEEDGTLNTYPKFIDIRVGTICNLKCIHCGTGASSKWNEDKELLNKYQNTEQYNINNKWIEQDILIWDSMREHINSTERLNFLGGEPFANKQHNKFLKEISQTDRAKKIILSYVTNGTLVTEEMLDQMIKFRAVLFNVSIDATEKAGEYFRFPIKWEEQEERLLTFDRYAKENSRNFYLRAQWTCSNVSMFYFIKTWNFIKDYCPNTRFILCNHVEWPVHMSAQVLPLELKLQIKKQVENNNWGEYNNKVKFYVNHMMEKDLWPVHGNTFMNYLDDLDRVRKISWRDNFSEMNLEKYDPR